MHCIAKQNTQAACSDKAEWRRNRAELLAYKFGRLTGVPALGSSGDPSQVPLEPDNLRRRQQTAALSSSWNATPACADRSLLYAPVLSFFTVCGLSTLDATLWAMEAMARSAVPRDICLLRAPLVRLVIDAESLS